LNGKIFPASSGVILMSANSAALANTGCLKPYKRVEGTHQVEHFFRAAAGLDVDKDYIKRYYVFIDQKIDDSPSAQYLAKANDRITVEPRGLPITKRLQQCVHDFDALDLDIGLRRILEHAVPEPQIDLLYREETGARLPAIADGLSLAFARTFKIILNHRFSDFASRDGTAGPGV
jgi:hypothetical protein